MPKRRFMKCPLYVVAILPILLLCVSNSAFAREAQRVSLAQPADQPSADSTASVTKPVESPRSGQVLNSRRQRTITDAAGRVHERPVRVSPAERQAAATRVKAARFAAGKKTSSKTVTFGAKAMTTASKSVATFGASAMAMPSSPTPDFFGIANYANSPLPIRSCSDVAHTACFGDMDCSSLADAIDPTQPAVCNGAIQSGGIRKFVDGLPGLTPAGENNLHQYIPVALADAQQYPNSDYYEIAVVEYSEKMHTDLPATKLRGYVQLETTFNASTSKHYALPNGYFGYDKPHYLGPVIVAQKNRPVRILFRNLLPTGAGGNLFLPVDTTVMGAGMGPNMNGMAESDPQNPMCGAPGVKPVDCYSENRATLHLHGGITPWISDGTPHQWVTPAGENTSYPKGVSVQNVPDMPDPGPGAITFFYTNQQSARLLFYHDHAWGITRLNVYAGEAAGYVIQDDAEKALINKGLIPKDQIPLIVQDKTFVPSPEQLATTDPLWDVNRWGGLGNIWAPHVYMPAQNPGDSSGVNAFGRWAYGPWFWPPTQDIKYGPKPNPLYDPNCNPDGLEGIWCQPELNPGVPNLSMGMEAFNDTPLVNGTVYPTVTLEPKAYRLRILNAANDRFFNLQLYKADASGKEVALNPLELSQAQSDPIVFPTPDTTVSTPGPSWIQIGTEGGFLPAPVVVPQQPITWVTDPTVFNAGNVDKHSLLLGPAERADVILDLSNYKNQTLILYNDAPAAFPARDPRYDYYTGGPDMTATGGAPTTQPGYGPNTRTVMQIIVSDTCNSNCAGADLVGLQTAFKHGLDANNNPTGVFETDQHPIVVGQGAYNSAYGTKFRSVAPMDGFARIQDQQLTFNTLSGNTLTMPFQPKALHDEMGASYDKDYGRMSGNLGLEAPNATTLTQNIILYPYVNPASEILDGLTEATPITTTTDGTQIWKITHNGVDTHPIHFHLFDVQLINRVGWDNVIRKPEASELGWKDTVRVSPLEDTIVAFRPLIPKTPFGVPDSIRPLNPMMPLHSPDMFVNLDANANALPTPLTNELTNFGWEYVWHCHILSHEEMDMMRPMILNVPRALPPAPGVTLDASSGTVNVNWTDGTPVDYTNVATWGNPLSEIGFRVERATVDEFGVTGDYTKLASILANVTTYNDTTATGTDSFIYRVVAYNAAGESSGTASQVPPVKAPGNLLASASTNSPLSVTLTWLDNFATEAGFTLQRASDPNFTTGLTSTSIGAQSGIGGTVTYTDSNVPLHGTVYYRVAAFKGAASSPWSNTASIITGVPVANNQSVKTNVNTPVNITLVAADNDGDTLTYSIVGQPAHGTLSGTAPNVTYTPANNYVGADSFTFKANDGFQDSNVATVSITVVPVPTIVSVSPNSGTAASQTFTYVITNPTGASAMNFVQGIFNTAVSYTGGCAFYYDVATSRLRLNTDAGGWMAPLVAGLPATQSNSQCTLNAGASSAVISGNTLTLNVALTFVPFSGVRNIYALAADPSTNTGWKQMGTWGTAPVIINQPPTADSVTPNGAVGSTQNLTFQFSSVNGFAYVTSAQIIINSAIDYANACAVTFDSVNKTVRLMNDAGVTWSAPVALGTAGTLQNTKCSIDTAASTLTGSGNSLQFKLAVTGKSVFLGSQNIYAIAFDKDGRKSAWTQLGTWTPNVPLATPPSVVSVTKNGGLVTYTFSDVNGGGFIGSVQSIIGSTFGYANSCSINYNAARNTIALMNNAGNNWGTAITLGQAGTLSNSQCTINVGASTRTVFGNNLTLNVSVTFTPAFTGTRNAWSYAVDGAGKNSGWTNLGSFLVN